MSLSALKFAEDFRHATEQFQAVKPKLGVEVRTLRQALEPVHDHMQIDPVYAGHEISVDYQLKYLRQTCNELHIAKEGHDAEFSENQKVLLQSLNNIMEDVQDSQNGIANVTYDDLITLSQLSDVMRSDAQICKKEMFRELGDATAYDLHDMLVKTADRFDAAQERSWTFKDPRPSFDLDAAASNDEQYNQPVVA